jgi:hypothetical protein
MTNVHKVDPIFAAIERHRICDAAFEGAPDRELDTYAIERRDAYVALLSLTPTTIAGCPALLRYVEEHEAKYGNWLFDECSDPVRSAGEGLFSRIAGALGANA